MPDSPTRAELFDLGAAEIRARSDARPPGTRVNPDVVFLEGSDLNILNASASAMADEVVRQVVLRETALFLDGAKREDLDRLVADRFSPTVVRKAATPSVGDLVLTRVAGALPAFTLPAGSRIKTGSGVDVETTVTVSLAAGSNGPVTAPAQARTAGISGNVAANTLTQFSTPPSDPEVHVTNPEPFAGGDETETDARLRARARNFFLTARRGTFAAIEFGALTVPGVRQATAVEEIDAFGHPTGRVALYVADALGQGNAALVSAVRNAEVEYRAAGVWVDASGSIPTFVPIRYRLRFAAGVDSTRAFDLVRSATIAAVNALPPNATLQVSLLFSVARSVAGVIVDDDAVQEPVGDLVPSPGQAIRTRIDLVTAE